MYSLPVPDDSFPTMPGSPAPLLVEDEDWSDPEDEEDDYGDEEDEENDEDDEEAEEGTWQVQPRSKLDFSAVKSL